jgi:hypothetical protein
LAYTPKLVAAPGGSALDHASAFYSTVFAVRLYGCGLVSIQITRRFPH